MILADTSVWVDHFRHRNAHLKALLEDGLVMTHPFVIGELACGNLRQRSLILEALSSLPSVTVATHGEALRLVERHALWGTGLGWIDVHLLGGALLSGCRLWTLDRRLARAAARAGAGYAPPR